MASFFICIIPLFFFLFFSCRNRNVFDIQQFIFSFCSHNRNIARGFSRQQDVSQLQTATFKPVLDELSC